MIPRDLLAAYQATRYVVDASPVGSFTLRIGTPAPAADRLCEMLGDESWVYITACNPRSRALTPAENAARMADLKQALQAQGLPFFPGAGIGDDGRWPPEPSVFVPGVERQTAIELGRRFDQYAVVYGVRGGVVELLPTRV